MLTPCNLLSPWEGEKLEPLPGLFEWGRLESEQFLARGYWEPELECMSSQTSSERVTFKVRTKRHWFSNLTSGGSLSILNPLISSEPGPALTSATPECSDHLAESPSKRPNLRIQLICCVWLGKVAIPQEVVLSKPTTRRTSPFLTSQDHWHTYTNRRR